MAFGGWVFGCSTRTGRSSGTVGDGPNEDLPGLHEHGEDRETEGDESREGDERHGPECRIHAPSIGRSVLARAVPVRVIFAMTTTC
jgi:hypothetical protein